MLRKGQAIKLTILLCAGLWLAACSDPRFSTQQAPRLDLPDLAGEKRYRLNDFSGQVVYITFWASWCAPCRQEIPFLVELHNRYANRGFEILAINEDLEVQEAIDFIKPFAVPFPLLRDQDGEALKAYNVEGMPTHFILDRSGRVFYSHMGFKEEDKSEIEQQLAALFKSSASAQKNRN